MVAKIKGIECTLAKIFSSEFDYEIPYFQRPYAWTTEQTEELFDDLYSSFENEGYDGQYFLGSIVLIKSEDYPCSKVIDGQQRLTTLTILLALITTMVSEAERSDFKKYVIEPGRKSQNIPTKPRLHLRKKDQPFFEKYVQNMLFTELFESNVQCETDAQENIKRNALLLKQKIHATFFQQSKGSEGADKVEGSEKLEDFGRFLVSNCFLIAVSTPSEESACRIFSVMNSRGLNLLPTDIIKANTINRIDESLQDEYNQKWEEIETDLGREEFLDLINAIRMIKRRTKAQFSTQEEFSKFILTSDATSQDAIKFIDDVLIPYAEAYEVVKNSSYKGVYGAEKINELLRGLNSSPNNDWIPVAMNFYFHHKDEPETLQLFLKKLDRLVSLMNIDTKWNSNRRPERFGKIIADIENSQNSSDFGSSIELTDSEQSLFVELLKSDVFSMNAQRRRYLVLRLNAFIAEKGAPYDFKKCIFEYVLPDSIKDGSDWQTLWPDQKVRELWLNKLANIVLLSRNKSSKYQNSSFADRKKKYFMDNDGTSVFALTEQIDDMVEWTPQVVEQRQRELVRLLMEKWDISVNFDKDRLISFTEDSGSFKRINFYCTNRGSDAHGYQVPNGRFVLEKGSRISSMPSTEESRDNLLKQHSKSIVDYVLQEDILCKSANQALVLATGGHLSANREWRTADGVSLGDVDIDE